MRLRAISIATIVVFMSSWAVPARSLDRSKWRPNIDLHEVAERVGMDWALVSPSPGLRAWWAVAAEYERFAAWRSFSHCLSDMRNPRPDSDHQRIAFASDRDGDFEIYVMDADGSNVTQITDNRVDDVRPDWAPDGRRLAFTRGKHIHIADVDRGTECFLGFQGTRIEGTHAAWSPDGEWIAYSVGECDGSAVIAVRLDGTSQAVFVDGGESWVALDPTWVDRNFVAYQDLEKDAVVVESLRHAYKFSSRRLFRMRHWIRGPVSSPNGTVLLFAAGPRGGGWDHDMPHTDFDLLAFEDGRIRAVDAHSGWNSLVGSWSPDGSRIAMYSDRAGSYDIYAIGLQGEGLDRLTDHPANDITPDWSH